MEKMQRFLEREVPGWEEDDVKIAALFKAFSGQREDWQGRLEFWKALILKLARHLDTVVIDADEVQQRWFLRGGLLPLCLNDVLCEMLKSGELQAMDDTLGMQRSRLGWLVSGVGYAVTWALGLQGSETDRSISGKFIVPVLLKERVGQICKVLADNSWKQDCIVTMKTFVELCRTIDDAKAIMHYLVQNQLARHLYINAKERIEGLKVSLVQTPVAAPSKLDYNMLQLFWTSEKMKQRFDVLNQRVLQLREAALASLKIKDKQAGLRHLRSMKALSHSRDKCADLMAKIHEILDVIADAEATKKVSEAIQLGNEAMKEHHVTLEEVHGQLKELDESILLGRQIADAFAVTADNVDEDEELEGEFANLEAEVQQESELETALPSVPADVPTKPTDGDGEQLEKAFTKMRIEEAA